MIFASGETAWEALLPSLIMAACLIAVLPFLDREEKYARAAVVGGITILMLRYLVWRVADTIPPAGLTADFIVGVCFTSVEALMLVGSIPSLMYLARFKSRSADADANMGWLLEQSPPPLVDVFICTYNENEDILTQTIVGSMAMTYPNFRVWICDDGRRDWLEALCTRLGCGYIKRGDNAHAKAGNINNAIAHVMGLTVRPQFISVLDADFVPFPQFLTRTMALMRDEAVGVVQTPQHFRNPDPIQANLGISRVWPDEQRYFFDILLAGKDAWNASFCCGTSSVIRLEPLLAMGGFPTDSVTEDLLVTMRLAERGYTTVYLNEALSIGLSPEGMREYVVQRSRWCLGFMQVFRGRSAPYRLSNRLPLRYRVMILELFIHWATAYLFRLMGLVIPALFFVLGIQAVRCDGLDAIRYFVPYIVFQTIATAWLTRCSVLPLLTDIGQVLTAKEIVRSVWVGMTRPNGQKFQVTTKGGDRSKTFVQWPMLRFFLGLFALNAAAIAWRFFVDSDSHVNDADGVSLFWCWYNFIVLGLACGVVIERPRLRDERYPTSEVAGLTIPGGAWQGFVAINISVGGIKLRGAPPVDVGGRVDVSLNDVAIQGRVLRVQKDAFVVAFIEPSPSREVMTRYIYSGRLSANVYDVKPRRIVAALVRRALAPE